MLEQSPVFIRRIPLRSRSFYKRLVASFLSVTKIKTNVPRSCLNGISLSAYLMTLQHHTQIKINLRCCGYLISYFRSQPLSHPCGKQGSTAQGTHLAGAAIFSSWIYPLHRQWYSTDIKVTHIRILLNKLLAVCQLTIKLSNGPLAPLCSNLVPAISSYPNQPQGTTMAIAPIETPPDRISSPAPRPMLPQRKSGHDWAVS